MVFFMRKITLITVFFSVAEILSGSPHVLDISMDQALRQAAVVYSTNTAAAERNAALRTIIDILANDAGHKAAVSGFLDQMMSERLGSNITAENTDIPMLVDFLKTFSKGEAIHILHLWIQANTDPNNVNERYDPPEVFMKDRAGDCTEVAWLAETILKQQDIETTVFLARYSIDYSLKNGVAGHAFTGLEFIENSVARRYIIDNRDLHELSLEPSWKDIIWQTYSRQSGVWAYRKINTSRWRNLRKDQQAKELEVSAKNRSVIFVPMPRAIAVKEFKGHDLRQYFDDSVQETLLFRDDFQQTIYTQRQAGKITDSEYTRFLNLWREHENNGRKK